VRSRHRPLSQRGVILDSGFVVGSSAFGKVGVGAWRKGGRGREGAERLEMREGKQRERRDKGEESMGASCQPPERDREGE